MNSVCSINGLVPGSTHAVPALDQAHVGALLTEALVLERGTHVCNQLESWQADWAVLHTAEWQGQITTAEVLPHFLRVASLHAHSHLAVQCLLHALHVVTFTPHSISAHSCMFNFLPLTYVIPGELSPSMMRIWRCTEYLHLCLHMCSPPNLGILSTA
jgi:hypothetical protein